MKTVFSIILLLFSTLCFSQEEDIKVGLVLSGGGAKGLAHIGVLKVLEEAGVRIDYIGGTSVGAVVGALYASGYSATQLDSIFHETNFTSVIQDDLPRRAKTFYEKEDAGKYALTLPFDDFKVSFPSGLSKGQNLYNLIARLTAHVDQKEDFKKLPIPFFCVATNIETGEVVILEEGSLTKAVSASSAIPSVFSPVEIDDLLLIDGGVVNNFPVREMQKRGVDFIIGVDVQNTLVDRKKLKSAIDILVQISNFVTSNEMEVKKDLADIYIKPDVTNFNLMSFEKGNQIIDSGEVAAKKHFLSLKSLAARQKAPLQKRKEIILQDSVKINYVTFTGISSYPRSYVLGKLQIKAPVTISYEKLSMGINNLSATGNFSKINYNLTPLEDGYELIVEIEENKNTSLLRLGLHYDNLYKSGALINFTKKRILFGNDNASLDLVVGDNFRYNFKYYIDKGYYWSIGVHSKMNGFNKNVDVGFAPSGTVPSGTNINKLAVDYLDITNRIYVETIFSNRFSFGLGAEHKFLDIKSETIQNLDEEEESSIILEKNHYYSGFGYLKLDTFDNRYFPTKGLMFNADFHIYPFSSSFNEVLAGFSVAKANATYVVSPIKRIATRFTADGGFRIGENNNKYFDFFLGGYGNAPLNNIESFLGYDFLDISANSYLRAQVDIDYRFYRKNHFILSANFAKVENNLFETGNWFSLPDYSGYALGYGLETFMGPMEVKYSYSPETKNSIWFFSLGFWF